MQQQEITFITTVFNEDKTIIGFLESLFLQSKIPNKIVIVDGGSTDNTVEKIKNQISKIKYKKLLKKTKFNILIKKGNRSVGRNEAIKNASGNIIVCSDAGCVLDKDWVKNIIEPFKNPNVGVVAGYYEGFFDNIYQKSLIPYVLVMPDKIDKNHFLPSTRSMAFTKKTWEEAGGFPEKYSHNEDYVFANKLKQNNVKIIFEKKAIVYWYPRKNIYEAFYMFYRFALGDAEAKIIRPKVILIFLRYFFIFLILIYFFVKNNSFIIYILFLILVLYYFWAVFKNFRYVQHWKAFYILPMLQIISDIAILLGTTVAFFTISKNNN